MFPHAAEADLRDYLATSCINITTFNSYIIKTYLITITSERDCLVDVLRADQALTKELELPATATGNYKNVKGINPGNDITSLEPPVNPILFQGSPEEVAEGLKQ